MLSLGIKYRTQSEVKLALSGLLNPREGVISLFCSSTCASHCCHTSNYKLIGLKMQKRLHLILLQILHRQISSQSWREKMYHVIFNCFNFPHRLLLDADQLMYVFTCMEFTVPSSQTPEMQHFCTDN